MLRTGSVRGPGTVLPILGPILILGLMISPDAVGQKAEPNEAAKSTAAEFRLEIRGDAARPLKFTAEEWADLPRKSVRAKAHDGKESTYEGVPLIEILSKAGVPTGREALALFVVIEAADGYRALFALPELDPAFTDRVILLADRIDGRPLDAKSGPLRVIVPGEKKQARSVRQVIAIRVGRS